MNKLPEVDSLQMISSPDRLSCSAIVLNHVLTLSMSGMGELPDQSELAALLKRAHQVALSQKVSRVLVDFEGLKFMNSSCFKAFVSWMAEVTQLPEAARYNVHFKLNPTRRWQRVSVSALACFAVNTITFDGQ
jgi:hypothetical protein